MSATSARRLVTAGSLSLALALAAPAAAFAQDQEPERGPSEQAQEGKKEQKQGQGGGSGSSAGSSGGSGGSGKSGAGNGAGNGAVNGAGNGRGSGEADRGAAKRQGGQGKPAGEARGGDPRGNNGTVKVDGEPFDSTPGNEPHVGCTFQVDFFGFDAGDTALVTLTGHAPTGGGQLYSARHTISTDAAGGGQDVDESITFTAAQLGLFSITPHPQQGWHIKLAADVDSAPGGAKQKVFWVTCAPTATTGTATSGTTASGTDTTADAAAAAGAGSGGARGVLSVRALEQSAPELTLGAGTLSVAGTSTQAGSGAAATDAGAGAATVAARGSRMPSTLPFTGAEGVAYLLALGASAVGVGTLAHRLGRRRASAEV